MRHLIKYIKWSGLALLATTWLFPAFAEPQKSSRVSKLAQQKRILIAVTSHSSLGESSKPTGFYLPEVTHAYYRFIEAGFQVDFVSPKGGIAPMDPNGTETTDEYNNKYFKDTQLQNKISNTFLRRCCT